MRLVHLSDLHLGYRQYTRLAPSGINQREVDVAGTFSRAVSQIIAVAPDLVVIGGDIFHAVRPSNHAVLHAFMEFKRLVYALPSTPIVLVAGNHDTPRSTDTGGILQLFASLGIYVIDRDSSRIEFPSLNLSVLAVPDVPGLVRPPFTPNPDAQYNVVVIHGEAAGVMPHHVTLEDPAAVEISAEELNAPAWDYVGFGHYHVLTEIAPNAFYSGSIDYTSTNIWGELADQSARGLAGKGFIERDLATGAQTFHPLAASRSIVDLPPISVGGMAPVDIDALIRVAVDACPGGIDGAIVRLKVLDISRGGLRALDQQALREYKRRALNFSLDARRPATVSVVAGREVRRATPLAQLLRDMLGKRTLDTDIDPAEFTARAMDYLEQARDPYTDEPVVQIAAAEEVEQPELQRAS